MPSSAACIIFPITRAQIFDCLAERLAGDKVAVDNEVDGLLRLTGLEVAQDHVELI